MSEHEEVPCCSTSDNYDVPSYSEELKVRLKNAFVYCESLLAEDNLIALESSDVISNEAMLMGKQIYEYTMHMMSEMQLITDEELIHVQEQCEDTVFSEVMDKESSPEYEPEPKKAREIEHIPLDYKIKVVNIAKLHPKWTLQTLQKKGCSRLKKMSYIATWKAEIEKGGNTYDKYSIIDSWTYDRFTEARQRNQQVTTRNLQQWALTAASQFPDFEFKASDAWIKKFKKKHRIRQHKVTKYVSSKEVATMDQILEAAEMFRSDVRDLLPQFNEAFVINTDPIGCQYQSVFHRSLETEGSKTVFVQRKDMNKVTHFYTAQYSLTLSGKVLPLVFVCLQETTGAFGPRVQKQIDEFSTKYSNVVIVSSKSGKSTTDLYKTFLQKCIKTYTKDEEFLLLVDSCGGQTSPEIYDETFRNKNKKTTCTLKIIPPQCAPLVQPCDVYFYHQVKNMIEKLQNCAYLIENSREINFREDCIKIQSVVHHQLSAPIFTDMIQYAWHASRLSEERELFLNVNEVCFSTDMLKTKCDCNRSSFICCSYCRKVLCFHCFYDDYHPRSCK